jgi:hypothetical protein
MQQSYDSSLEGPLKTLSSTIDVAIFNVYSTHGVRDVNISDDSLIVILLVQINTSHYIPPSHHLQNLPCIMNSSIGNTGSCHVPQNGLRSLSLVSLYPLRPHNENRILSSSRQQGPPLSRTEHRQHLMSIIDDALAFLEEDWDVDSCWEEQLVLPSSFEAIDITQVTIKFWFWSLSRTLHNWLIIPTLHL